MDKEKIPDLYMSRKGKPEEMVFTTILEALAVGTLKLITHEGIEFQISGVGYYEGEELLTATNYLSHGAYIVDEDGDRVFEMPRLSVFQAIHNSSDNPNN
jgi:hypothetical protein